MGENLQRGEDNLVSYDPVYIHRCGEGCNCHCIYRDKWCYDDESYSLNGPFDSEHEARLDLVLYCHYCLDGQVRFTWYDYMMRKAREA